MSSVVEEYLHHTIVDYHKEGDWEAILKLKENFGKQNVLEKYLWVWPGKENLSFIKGIIDDFDKCGIISVGCGCGLLEWILFRATGITTIGYEVNREWWTSKYSAPKFIKLNYVEMPPSEENLDPSYALLFCYFNDGRAFLDYVGTFRGDLVIIIGPGDGAKKYTDPMPFKANFGNPEWKLYACQEIKNSNDYIAVYTKKIVLI